MLESLFILWKLILGRGNGKSKIKLQFIFSLKSQYRVIYLNNNNFLLFLSFFFLGDYTLKIDLTDFEKNSRFAQYKHFKVGDKKVLKVLIFKIQSRQYF